MARPNAETLGRRTVVAGSLVFLATPLLGEEAPKTDSPQSGTADSSRVVFVPPKSGRPADRVGAGTRSIRVGESLLTLLVPEGGGLTTLAKPPLIWRLNAAVSGRMWARIDSIPPDSTSVGIELKGKLRKGWYALALDRSKLSLAPGKIYRWEVTFDPAPADATTDRRTSYVECVDNPAGVLGTARDAAAAGLWFDALVQMVSVDLSGRVRVLNPERLNELMGSAGLELPE
jgi:hypothetical protein